MSQPSGKNRRRRPRTSMLQKVKDDAVFNISLMTLFFPGILLFFVFSQNILYFIFVGVWHLFGTYIFEYLLQFLFDLKKIKNISSEEMPDIDEDDKEYVLERTKYIKMTGQRHQRNVKNSKPSWFQRSKNTLQMFPWRQNTIRLVRCKNNFTVQRGWPEINKIYHFSPNI